MLLASRRAFDPRLFATGCQKQLQLRLNIACVSTRLTLVVLSSWFCDNRAHLALLQERTTCLIVQAAATLADTCCQLGATRHRRLCIAQACTAHLSNNFSTGTVTAHSSSRLVVSISAVTDRWQRVGPFKQSQGQCFLGQDFVEPTTLAFSQQFVLCACIRFGTV